MLLLQGNEICQMDFDLWGQEQRNVGIAVFARSATGDVQKIPKAEKDSGAANPCAESLDHGVGVDGQFLEGECQAEFFGAEHGAAVYLLVRMAVQAPLQAPRFLYPKGMRNGQGCRFVGALDDKRGPFGSGGDGYYLHMDAVGVPPVGHAQQAGFLGSVHGNLFSERGRC